MNEMGTRGTINMGGMISCEKALWGVFCIWCNFWVMIYLHVHLKVQIFIFLRWVFCLLLTWWIHILLILILLINLKIRAFRVFFNIVIIELKMWSYNTFWWMTTWPGYLHGKDHHTCWLLNIDFQDCHNDFCSVLHLIILLIFALFYSV